jgi:hypothetical protein
MIYACRSSIFQSRVLNKDLFDKVMPYIDLHDASCSEDNILSKLAQRPDNADFTWSSKLIVLMLPSL